MSRFSSLSRHIQDALQAIEPTHDSDFTYFPCSVTLTSGDVLDTVYFMPERPTVKLWEAYWQTDGAKRLIRVEDVAEVRDSPTRIPARFANELYQRANPAWGTPSSPSFSLMEHGKRVSLGLVSTSSNIRLARVHST